MKTLPLILLALIFSISLSGQLDFLNVERFNKKLELVVADPFIAVHFPTGLIYQDTSGNSFANLSDRLLRIADGPIGFQFQPNSVVYSELTKNSLSFNVLSGSGGPIIIGPNPRASWGPRNFGTPFELDLNTFGNIWSKDIQGRKLSELTVKDDKGALKLYRYPNVFTTACSTVTIDNNGAPVWTASSSTILGPIVENHSLLKRMKNIDVSKTSSNMSNSTANKLNSLFPELSVTLEDGTEAINYMKIGPLALQAVIEQQAIIEALEDRIERLEKLIAEK